MIHVLAIVTTHPGRRAEVLAAFHANMPAVHAEAGCIEYGPVVDAEGLGSAKFGPDTFVVIEKWESAEALAAHAKSPHMAAYGAKTKEMIASRAVHVLVGG
jgi:quinol monooxygenase YgiN